MADQRTTDDDLGAVDLTASRELLLSDDVRQRAREMLHEFPNLSQMLAKIAEGIPVEGMESLAPALVQDLVPVTSYLPDAATVAVLSPERVAGRAHSLAETNTEFLQAAWSAAVARAQAPIDLDAGNFLTVQQLKNGRGQRTWWTITPFDSGSTRANRDRVLTRRRGSGRGGGVHPRARRGHPELRRERGRRRRARQAPGRRRLGGRRHGAGQGLVERAVQVLADAGVAARAGELTAPPEPGVAVVTTASVEAGFATPDPRIALLSEAEFYGRSVQQGARTVKKLAARARTSSTRCSSRPATSSCTPRTASASSWNSSVARSRAAAATP